MQDVIETLSAEQVWVQPTPIGPIVVATGDQGIRSILFGASAHALAESLVDDARHGVPSGPARDIAQQLDEWFAGTRTELSLTVDLRGITGFRRTVLETLRREVGWGETVTYGELAALAGRPGAARAVGSCMAANPVPFVVPCHRVLASNGIGGYGGTADTAAANLAMKRWLLQHEEVHA